MKASRMFRRTIWATAVVLLAQQTAVYACSCGGFQETQNVLPTVPLIFEGEVVKAEILTVEESPTWYGTPAIVRATFSIKEVVKGNPRDGQQVYSVSQSSMCGVDFARMVGQSVRIAAFEENGKAITHLCLFLPLNRVREEPKRRRR
jgi:hypothetical protein